MKLLGNVAALSIAKADIPWRVQKRRLSERKHHLGGLIGYMALAMAGCRVVVASRVHMRDR
jgi:hypothetical protein